MRETIILSLLLLCGVTMLAGATAAVTLRQQLQAPQWYHDASINYAPRLPQGTIKIKVAEGDVAVMQRRVTNFISKQGGSYSTLSARGRTEIQARLPAPAGQYIRQLHAKRGLSADYRNWPGDAAPTVPNGGTTEATIIVKPVPYRPSMLHWGYAGIGVGICLTLIPGAILVSYIRYQRRWKRCAVATNP